jgi:hypothetical protein
VRDETGRLHGRRNVARRRHGRSRGQPRRPDACSAEGCSA